LYKSFGYYFNITSGHHSKIAALIGDFITVEAKEEFIRRREISEQSTIADYCAELFTQMDS
jgi:hypothetical protein